MSATVVAAYVCLAIRANKIVNYNSQLARTGIIWCNLYGRVSAEIESDDLTLAGGRGRVLFVNDTMASS